MTAGSTAATAGLTPGLTIVSANGLELAGRSYDAVCTILAGSDGLDLVLQENMLQETIC